MAQEVCKEYDSSLKDLVCNSKPHISMLTMLADENTHFAPNIVQVIEAHLQKVKPESKLPAIYLIDSIVKNVGGDYLSLFTQNLVSTFCSVFEKVDEKTRIQLFKLRQTWGDVFPNKKLYAIDVRVHQIDPAWPVTAQASIHVNPKFLKNSGEDDLQQNNPEMQEAEMRKQLIAKQQELLKLQQQKLELELLQTKAKLEEQKKLLHPTEKAAAVVSSVRNDEAPVTTIPADLKPPVPPLSQIGQPLPPLLAPLPEPPAQRPPLSSVSRPVSTATGKDPRIVRIVKDPRLIRTGKQETRGAVFTVLRTAVGNQKSAERVTEKETKMISRTGSQLRPTLDRAAVGTSKDIKSTVNVSQKMVEKKPDVLPSKPDKVSKKKETKKSISKSEIKAGCHSPSKREAKNKDGVVGKKVPEHKKDELKDKIHQHKPLDKNKKAEKKVGEKVTPDNSKVKKTAVRRGNGRGITGATVYNRKDEFLDVHRTIVRNRRNYRTNRDRSDSPDVKNISGLQDKDGSKDSDAKRIVFRGRSRSPLREREDKRPEKKNERRKKSPKTETETSEKGAFEAASSKETSSSKSTIDVDLRMQQSNTKKEKPLDEEKNVKETVERDFSGEEPPPKKLRKGDTSNLDNLFGTEDQDYRQLPLTGEQCRSPGSSGWAQYKADHPDEFKAGTPRSFKENSQRGDVYGFGQYDQDLRTSRDYHLGYIQGMPLESKMKFSRPFGNRHQRGHGLRRMRGFGRARNSGRLLEDDQVLRRHPAYQRYSTDNMMDPDMNIPNALSLDRQAEILKQADQQLKTGHLTPEQHSELLAQLGKLYELQLLRQRQKEETFCDKILSPRGRDNFQTRREYFDKELQHPYGSMSRFSPSRRKFDGEHGFYARKGHTQDGVGGVHLKNRQSEVLDIVSVELEQARKLCAEKLELDEEKGRETARDNDRKIEESLTETSFNLLRSITIDGKFMKILFIGMVAIILPEGESAQEISFKGDAREVYVDELTLHLNFNGETCMVNTDGKTHRFKFGAPTHEIYVDEFPYEAQFGGPPIAVMIDGKVRQLRLGGPSPGIEFKEVRESLRPEVLEVYPGAMFDCLTRMQPKVIEENVQEVKVSDLADKRTDDSTEELQVSTDDTVQVKKNVPVEEPIVEKLITSEEKTDLTVIEKPLKDLKMDVDEFQILATDSVAGHAETHGSAEKGDYKFSESVHRHSTSLTSAHAGTSERNDASQSPVYHGSYTKVVSHPDFQDYKLSSQTEDTDYRIFNRTKHFNEEPSGGEYISDTPLEGWQEPWHGNVRSNDPLYRGERPHPRDYREMQSRDEYVPEYWHKRDDEYHKQPPHFRERGRRGSPQRMGTDYPSYRDNIQQREVHRDFPPFQTNIMGMRPDASRPRFEGMRPHFEGGRGRFEPRPRFDHGIRRPHGGRFNRPLFFSGAYSDNRRGGFHNRPGYHPPIPDRTVFLPQAQGLPDTVDQQTAVPSVQSVPAVIPQVGSSSQFDVSELFQRLVQAGIINKSSAATTLEVDAKKEPAAIDKENVNVADNEDDDDDDDADDDDDDDKEDYKVPPIELTSECLRGRYPGVIAKLYRGIQCSSCGLRFTSEQTEKYAQHLDWHFRQNRRERDSIKKAVSRKWYYDVQDWIQYEEIEDMEERARSLFEVQANEDQNDQSEDLQSVPVKEDDEDNVCIVCGEPFEQFWDEEKEEWHLRDSIRADDKTYHPGCYEDIRNVSESAEETESKPALSSEGVPKSAPEASRASESMEMEVSQEPDVAVKEEEEEGGDATPVRDEPMDIGEEFIDANVITTLDQLLKREPSEPMVQTVEQPVIQDIGQSPIREPTETPVTVEVLDPVKLKIDEQSLPLEGVVSETDQKSVAKQIARTTDIMIKPEPVETDERIQHQMSGPVIKQEPVEDYETACTQSSSDQLKKLDLGVKPEFPPFGIENENATNLAESDVNVVVSSEIKPDERDSGSNFTVLPPIMRGTDMSGLCTIL